MLIDYQWAIKSSNMNFATYTYPEISGLLQVLGEYEISILVEIVEEEQCLYQPGELESIYTVIADRLDEIRISS